MSELTIPGITGGEDARDRTPRPARRRDAVITGIPRSGTTLTCYLLGTLPDTVALHEPLRSRAVAETFGADAIAEWLDVFFRTARASLLTTGYAVSKMIDGRVPQNPVEEAPNASSIHVGVRQSLKHPLALLAKKVEKRRQVRKVMHKHGRVHISKPLREDFLLCVKHNELFTYLLHHLAPRFDCYAIVRNPLAILASWNTVDFKLRTGRMAVERYLNLEHLQLSSLRNPTDRQVKILHSMFEQYKQHLPSERIIRYEDIVASGGRALALISPDASGLDEELTNRNANPVYDRRRVRALGDKLLASAGAAWAFYQREDVEHVMEEMLRRRT